MKMTFKISSTCLWAATAMLACASLSGEATAAVFTWAGNAGNWGVNASWLNNAQPANGDSVLFTNAGSGTTSTVNLSRTIADITFDASANRTFALVNNNSFTTTLGSLINNSGYRQIVNNNISLSSTSGVINTGTAGILLGSRLTGTGTYSKTGSGLLEITNANNAGYTGTLSVDEGSVKLTAGLLNATVNVNSGATLYGENNFANGYAGAIVVNNGGTLTPGDNGYGGLNVTNNTTLNAGSASAFGVGSESDFDQVSTGGLTTFGGALTISMDYTPTTFGTTAPYFLDGDDWALFSSGSFAGDFTSINMTGVYGNVSFTKIDNDVWQSQYLGNGQQFNFYVNSVNGGVAGTLYAVPEPSTIVFAGIGMAMFGWSTLTRRRAKARQQAIEAAIA
jgi:autotransporter-associated beta strand protein